MIVKIWSGFYLEILFDDFIYVLLSIEEIMYFCIFEDDCCRVFWLMLEKCCFNKFIRGKFYD